MLPARILGQLSANKNLINDLTFVFDLLHHRPTLGRYQTDQILAAGGRDLATYTQIR